MEVLYETQSYFVQNLQSKIYRVLAKNEFTKFIFICIGSNKIIGDSFGPLVGQYLQNRFFKNNNIKIYGTINEPVHFLNIEKYSKKIQEEKACTIAVDSAFSNIENLGKTYANWGGMTLGKAFQKNLYLPTNINIKTVIAENKNNVKNNFESITKLKNTEIQRLSFQVANDICRAIDIAKN